MKRANVLHNFIVAVGLLGLSDTASAAILSFGCQGQLGDQAILFNRDGLYIADTKPPASKARKFTADTVGNAIDALKQAKTGFTEFASDGSGELDETLKFSLIDANNKPQTIVFTHVSSKRLSHKHRMICGRDEDTDLYSSIYRYERDGEPAREIKMQCFWYQLSTRGSRKGCSDD